jgi:glycerophosphoryl diester phosphodiesterase
VATDGSRPYRGQGIRVPTLRDLLAAHPDVPLNIEVKQDDPPIVERVLADLDAYGARERTCLAAEHHQIMERIRAAAPDVATSFSSSEVGEFVYRLHDGRLAGYRPAGIALQVPPEHEGMAIVTAESVAAAHQLGLEVHVWTINDEGEMTRLLDLGVDALMTDLPERGAAVLRRRGQRP